MAWKSSQLLDQFKQLLFHHQGDRNKEFDKIGSVDSAQPQSLVFCQDKKALLRAISSPASVIISTEALLRQVNLDESKAYLITTNVALCQVHVTTYLVGRYAPLTKKGHIDSRAVISSSAIIGDNCYIGPYAVVEDHVSIGDNTYIGAHSYIEADAQVGSNSYIWKGVFIGYKCKIGDRCHIHPNTVIGSEGFGFAPDEKGITHRIPQIGNVVIEDDVEIGANCTIDRATYDETRIGCGTKLDNLIHISHNCRIGKYCILTSGFAMAGSSTLGDYVITGGRVSVTDHVNIASQVQLAGLSGVSKDVTEKGNYGGYPLQPLKDYLRTYSSLPQLPEIRRDISEIKKQIEELKK